MKNLTKVDVFPTDWKFAALVGRIWDPVKSEAPMPVGFLDGHLFDLSENFLTSSQILNTKNPREALRTVVEAGAREIEDIEGIINNTCYSKRDEKYPFFLSPIDLQAIKACGVTFVSSMVERVIEENAKGDLEAAASIRKLIGLEIGNDISNIVPGSVEAEKLKASLVRRGLWSQYLEVGIGADAEVFTKAQPMSSVGTGSEIGIRSDSKWNNPEPEVVLLINRAGSVVGATLGNDVNLRDFEGRSALLLSKAKDNNASCAIGPFVRLIDDTFTMTQLTHLKLEVSVRGADGYSLEGASDLSMISRPVSALVSQTINRSHQYPDGLALFLGTQFAPTEDRDEKGKGFSHRIGDIVQVKNHALGALINRVEYCENVCPWTYGVGDLIEGLSSKRNI